MTDIRTYPVTPVTIDALRAELKAHRDERQQLLSANVRLFHENNRLRAELGQCASENNQLTENAAELGQALDMALAERDAAFAEVDATNKRHAEIIERWKVEETMWRDFDKKQLAEIDALRAELDAMRRAHSVIAARMDAMGC